MSVTTPRADAAMTVPLDLGTAGGPRVAIKECLAIAGHPTRCGSPALADAAPAPAHAAAVQTLIDAGCHITGRANMHELAYGMTGANALTGTPENPRWPDRIPGGSSSGSAVLVAQGAVDFSIGTDTGGSIRQPACCCGIFGMKPTFGRIPRDGAIPVSSSLDAIGPFAPTALALTQAMSSLDPTFTPQAPFEPRLAVVATMPDADIAQAFDAALAHLPAAQAIGLPSLDAAFTAGMSVIAYEMASEFSELAASDAPMGADVRARLLKAREITPDEVAEAETIRARFTAEVDAALEGVDALILPTMPCVPPTWEQAADPQTILPLTRFIRPFNLSGHPALTIPILTTDGLPAGLQLVARKGADAALCAMAEWIAARLPEEEQK